MSAGIFVHGGGEFAGVVAGLLPRPPLPLVAAAWRGLDSGLGKTGVTTRQAASLSIYHKTDINS